MRLKIASAFALGLLLRDTRGGAPLLRHVRYDEDRRRSSARSRRFSGPILTPTSKWTSRTRPAP